MAEIYLARHEGIGGFERLLVIKKVLPTLARETRFIEMFLDEARIASQLNHPNIVQIYDVGRVKDDYFIAMEYLEGESLGALVQACREKETPLPRHLAAGIMSQVCNALDYAHHMTDMGGQPLGIVHRDVSPHNIIVLNSGLVKLVDFGIAKAASKMHQTRVGTLKGKFAYMAPEQLDGKELDARTDIFSTGIVLWELLARRRLFKRENEGAVVKAILYEPIPPLSSVQPGMPERLEKIVEQALQRDPGLRYRRAGEMASELNDFLRENNTPAGMPEISAFVTEILGERSQTRRKVLDALRKGEAVAARVIKPDTEESLPSASGVSEAPAAEEPAAHGGAEYQQEAATVLSKPKPGKSVSLREKKSWLILLTAAALSAAAAAFLAWLFFPTEVNKGEREAPPTKRLTEAVATTPTPPPTEPAAAKKPDEESLAKVDTLSLENHQAKVASVEPTKPVVTQEPPSEKVVGEPKPATKKKPYGKLTLATWPWSEVWWGGRLLGVTPLVDVSLPAGTHQLTALNKSKGIEKKITVIIQPGSTTKMQVDLE